MRLFVAAAVLVVSGFFASARPVNPLELDIVRQIAKLPSWSHPLWHGLALVGSVPAIAVAGALALFLRRGRLGVKLVAAGTFAWGLTQVVERFIAPRPASALGIGGPGFVFPAEHVAIAGALATVAMPYLPRVPRRLAWPLVALVAVADVAVGRHYPLDALAGGFLGWFAGTFLHLGVGAPGRSTSQVTVRAALERAGIKPLEVVPARRGPYGELVQADGFGRGALFGPAWFLVRTVDGNELVAEVVRRGRRRAGFWYQLRRLVASLEVEDEPRLATPTHEVEHEAYVTLLAERAGVHTPRVLLAQELGHGPALLVRERLAATPLPAFGSVPDDELAAKVWEQVALLGEAGIAHHDLRAANVLVEECGSVVLTDFTFARTGAGPDRLAQDVAEMLVSLAAVFSPQVAVDSALGRVDRARLADALGYLNVLALPARIRQQCQNPRETLAALRELLASRLGCEQPRFRMPVRPSTLLGLVVGGGAVYLLLPQIGAVPPLLRAVEHARYSFLVAAFAAGLLTFPMAAASYLGAVRAKLPVGTTTATQVASAFTSRLTPGGIGGMGLNLIYLERRGVPRTEAIGSVALNQAAGAVVHALGFALALVVLGTGGLVHHVRLPGDWPVLVAVVGVLVAAGGLVGSRFGRRRLLEPGLAAGRELVAVVRQPKRALALFGGSAGVTLGNGFALVAALAAFDPRVSVLGVLAVYVGAAALASPAPTPGNLGAVEAALVAGLTGIGVPAEPAVAAVLSFRLLTFWLPILPGLVAFRLLQHRGVV